MDVAAVATSKVNTFTDDTVTRWLPFSSLAGMPPMLPATPDMVTKSFVSAPWAASVTDTVVDPLVTLMELSVAGVMNVARRGVTSL